MPAWPVWPFPSVPGQAFASCFRIAGRTMVGMAMIAAKAATPKTIAFLLPILLSIKYVINNKEQVNRPGS